MSKFMCKIKTGSCRVRIRFGFGTQGSDSDRFHRPRFGFGSVRPPKVRIRIGSASAGSDSDRRPVWFGFGIRTRGLLSALDYTTTTAICFRPLLAGLSNPSCHHARRSATMTALARPFTGPRTLLCLCRRRRLVSSTSVYIMALENNVGRSARTHSHLGKSFRLCCAIANPTAIAH